MSSRVSKALAFALVVLLLPAAGVSQTPVSPIDLGQMTVGAPPTGFAFGRTGQGAAGQWVVVADAAAGAERAVAQTSADTTDYRFPLAIYQAVTATNLDVQLRFKSVAGAVDQAGGIAIRVTSP